MRRGWRIFWLIIMALIITNIITTIVDNIVYNNIDISEWFMVNERMIIFGIVLAVLWVFRKLRRIGKG